MKASFLHLTVFSGTALLALQATTAQRIQLTPEQSEILSHMSLVQLDDGHGGKLETIRITGVNVQLVNGLGETETTNGLGNLIVGYNELGNEISDDRTGSHNLVVGNKNSYLSFGGLVAGSDNTVSGQFASVGGGELNRATGDFSVVAAGYSNVAESPHSAVLGGAGNGATGEFGVVVGGISNEASGFQSLVSGGANNIASGSRSVVSGGTFNEAQAEWSVVSAGSGNVASGQGSTVSGGLNNSAIGFNTTVSGGGGNVASHFRSTVSGGCMGSSTGMCSETP